MEINYTLKLYRFDKNKRTIYLRNSFVKFLVQQKYLKILLRMISSNEVQGIEYN